MRGSATYGIVDYQLVHEYITMTILPRVAQSRLSYYTVCSEMKLSHHQLKDAKQ
jgi:hypothetical protein